MSWTQAASAAMSMMGGGKSGEKDIAGMVGKVQTKQERNKTIAEAEAKDEKKTTNLGGVF